MSRWFSSRNSDDLRCSRSRSDYVSGSTRHSSRSERASQEKYPRKSSSRSSQPAAQAASGAQVAFENSGGGSNRGVLLLILFVLVALVVVGRLVYLQVIKADEYSAMAQAARTANIQTTPRRGTIYDRNGHVLATSIDATTIYANPYEIEDPESAASQLAAILGGDEDYYYSQLTSDDISFVYIERQADVDLAEEVEELGIAGIYFIEDTKRIYPYGEVGGQVIGIVGVDGDGLSGLELQYDDILSGTAGTLVVERGRDGTPIPGGVIEETAAVDGQDIIVSIDITMQESLEEALVSGVENLNAESGSAVLMDAATGEIYAIASLPLYDPNNPDDIEDASATQVKAITQAFEPGSIFKTVAALALLESGEVTSETEIYSPAVLEVDEYTISDASERSDTTMSLREVLANSSNVGISLMVETYLGFQPLYEKILQYNLTELTGVDYPGEASGYVSDQSDWSLVQSYNVSFGQGITVTPIQMVRFYAALLNDGVEVTPHFLIEIPLSDETLEYEEEQIIDDLEAIEELVDILESVVTDGTGGAAQIDGYRVAGKTSTAQIAEGGTYLNGVYNLCFVGFLPDLDETSPQLVCFVGANEVTGGGSVASVFKDIMTVAIDRYGIQPN